MSSRHLSFPPHNVPLPINSSVLKHWRPNYIAPWKGSEARRQNLVMPWCLMVLASDSLLPNQPSLLSKYWTLLTINSCFFSGGAFYHPLLLFPYGWQNVRHLVWWVSMSLVRSFTWILPLEYPLSSLYGTIHSCNVVLMRFIGAHLMSLTCKNPCFGSWWHPTQIYLLHFLSKTFRLRSQIGHCHIGYPCGFFLSILPHVHESPFYLQNVPNFLLQTFVAYSSLEWLSSSFRTTRKGAQLWEKQIHVGQFYVVSTLLLSWWVSHHPYLHLWHLTCFPKHYFLIISIESLSLIKISLIKFIFIETRS